MRIGILIRDFNTLNNYELRIIQQIINDPDLELSLLIKDGRKELKGPKSRLLKNVFSANVFSNVLFKLQCILEVKLFPSKITINRDSIIEELKKIDCIELYPQRKGFVDLFSDEESKLVDNYKLDIILRHEFNIIRGKILTSAKHGIWSFHHGDNAVNRGGPAGFWEIVLNQPYVGATLQQLTPALDGGNIIEKAYFNWSFSYIVTNNDVLESSVSLLFKNINKLKRGEDIQYQKSLVYYNPLYRKPNLKYVFIYLFHFYSSVLKKIGFKIISKLSAKRKYCWSLYASKGVFLETHLFNKKEIPLPKNEFWADPFLIKYNNELYAFFENYEYSLGKGKISYSKIINGKFIEVQDALNLQYHLSYPFLIQEGDDIYMIPETLEKKRLEVYKCIEFPNKWELYTTAFEGEEISDPTYFKDKDGNKWLFINKGYLNKPELHIYKVDSVQLKHIEPHRKNPVKIDTLTARNAGAIFQYEGEYHRPSQLNSHGFYGNGLNINKIIKLDMEDFKEERIITVHPNFKKNLVGLHHLHQIDNYFIFDVCNKLK